MRLTSKPDSRSRFLKITGSPTAEIPPPLTAILNPRINILRLCAVRGDLRLVIRSIVERNQVSVCKMFGQIGCEVWPKWYSQVDTSTKFRADAALDISFLSYYDFIRQETDRKKREKCQ